MVIRFDMTRHEAYAALSNNMIIGEDEAEDLQTPMTKIKSLQITDELDQEEGNLIWILGSEDGENYSICLNIVIDGISYTEDEFLEKLHAEAELYLE